AKPEPATQPAAVAPVAPPAPEVPKWPVNEKPVPATVTWDSQGLRIEAANSSLEQILKEFSKLTGGKVDGFSSDERVFGVYGPGKARDVLSELLKGAGYNVLMIGDLGQGAPRQVVLTARAGAAGPQAGSPDAGQPQGGSDEDADNGEEQPIMPQPVPQPAFRPGFGPGGQPRTPQQIMQEMQQRQQRLQEMQQQQQQPH
ncbi:MAG: hypothetical protein WCE75_12810, partial [Terracidiphilus sp.]